MKPFKKPNIQMKWKILSDAINQLLSLEKRKIEQFEKCMKVKRHVKNLRKMKTVIFLRGHCLIFMMSPDRGSSLSEHVYNKF